MFARITTTLMITIAAILVGALACPCSAQSKKARKFERMAAETGSIDGAIWTFRLEPKLQGPKRKELIRGKFRVSDLKIYQAETPEGELSKQVGVSKPESKERVTIAEFDSLKGINQARESTELKGKALLRAVKGVGIEGEFVDSEGFKWTMSIKRVQE